MINFTNEEYNLSKNEIEKVIRNCEKILPKFHSGTSQHTLLINRIHALTIGKLLIEIQLSKSNQVITFSHEELNNSLKPIESIIHKCKKAQSKFELDSKQYNRFNSLINTMMVCKALIENQL